MRVFADLVKEKTATAGTGSLTLSGGVPGFRSFVDAGIINGAEVSYGLQEGVHHEAGWGIYDSVTRTLSRNMVASSTGGLLDLTGSAVVFITALSEDFDMVQASAAAAAASLADVQAVTGAHAVNFAGAAAVEGQAVHGSNLNPVSSRYAVTVDGSGYLQIEFIAAAIDIVGWRNPNAVHKIGRTFTQTTEFTAANFTGTTSALGFGFTNARSTGANAVMGAEALYIYLRANGVLQIINNAGAVPAGYTLTLVGSTAMPTVSAGDVLTATYKKNLNNTGTITVQEGPVLSTYTVTPAPPQGLVCPVIRNTVNGTGTPGHASNWKPKLRAFYWDDATVTQNVVQTTANTINQVAVSFGQSLSDYGSPISYPTADPYAWDRRVRPSNFPSLPVTIVAVWGKGSVLLDRSIMDAYMAIYPELALNGVAYVDDATGGAPGTGALNDPTKPYTLDYALKSTPAQLIVQLDGTCKPPDFRDTDTYGLLRKIIVPLHRGSARWAITPADDLTTATWTATGGHADTWQASYTGAPGGTAVHRLAHKGVLDNKGFPSRARKCTSLTELDTVPRGYFVNTGSKIVHVKWDGEDINDIKDDLSFYWYDASGNSRVALLGGVELGVYGIFLDGLSVSFIPGATALPTLWIDNCLIQFSPTYGIGDTAPAGATLYAGRLRIHASEYDGINLNPHATLGSAFGMLVNSHISNAGDYEAFGLAGSANKQAVSLHGGLFARIGNYFEDCFGQQIADASTDPVLNGSWNVGNLVRDDTGLADSNIGWGFYGNAGDGTSARDHVAVIDTCGAVGTNILIPLQLEGGASAYVFNSPDLLPAGVYAGSVQPTAYTPDAPP